MIKGVPQGDLFFIYYGFLIKKKQLNIKQKFYCVFQIKLFRILKFFGILHNYALLSYMVPKWTAHNSPP